MFDFHTKSEYQKQLQLPEERPYIDQHQKIYEVLGWIWKIECVDDDTKGRGDGIIPDNITIFYSKQLPVKVLGDLMKHI